MQFHLLKHPILESIHILQKMWCTTICLVSQHFAVTLFWKLFQIYLCFKKANKPEDQCYLQSWVADWMQVWTISKSAIALAWTTSLLLFPVNVWANIHIFVWLVCKELSFAYSLSPKVNCRIFHFFYDHGKSILYKGPRNKFGLDIST